MLFENCAPAARTVVRWLDFASPALDLVLRLYVAGVFFKSGLTKIASWDATLYLFEQEYHVPLVPPEAAAYLGTATELAFPVLLALGIGGRLAALVLFAFNLTAVISYPGLSEAGLSDHWHWGLLLLVPLFHGPGRLSLDYLISRRLAGGRGPRASNKAPGDCTQDVAIDRAGIAAPPPVIYLGILALGLLFEWLYPTRLLDWPLAVGTGSTILAAGVIGLVASIRAIWRAHTPIDPYKPATALVSDGPFRLSRNPIYVSDTLVYIGLALILNAWWALALTPLLLWMMQVGVITREEEYLLRKFGDEYVGYQRRVRRWI